MITALSNPQFFPDAGTEFGQAVIDLPRRSFINTAVLAAYIGFLLISSGPLITAGVCSTMPIGFVFAKMAYQNDPVNNPSLFGRDGFSTTLVGYASSVIKFFSQPAGLVAYAVYMMFYGRDIYWLSRP